MQLEATDLVVLRGETLVLDGVSLSVGAGGALVLRGANGSGKSTLLRVLAGLLRPVAGSVRLDGADIFADAPSHARSVGLLGHLDAIKAGLSCVENLDYQARLAGRSRAEIGAALDRVALGRLAALPARLLSSGQKRRLAIARLLLSRGPLWLLDEPTTGLDDASVGLLVGLIAAHRDAGGTVVASTHLALPLGEETVLTLGPPA